MREGHLMLVFFVVVLATAAIIDHRVNALDLGIEKAQSYDDKIEEALEEAYILHNNYAELDSTIKSLTPTAIKRRVDSNQDIYDQVSIEKFCGFYYDALSSKFSFSDATEDRIKQAASILVFADMKYFYITYYDGTQHKISKYNYKDSAGTPMELSDSNYVQIWDLIDKTLTYYVNTFGNNGKQMKDAVMLSLDLNMDKTHFTWDKLAGVHAFFYYKGAHDKYSSRYTFSRLISKNVASMHYYWIGQNKSSGLPEYHVSGSDCVKESDVECYNSVKECAEEGAYPCSECLGVTFTIE